MGSVLTPARVFGLDSPVRLVLLMVTMSEQQSRPVATAKVPDVIACRMTEADRLIVSDIMIATGITDGSQVARAGFRAFHAELCARPGSPIKPRHEPPVPAVSVTNGQEG